MWTLPKWRPAASANLAYSLPLGRSAPELSPRLAVAQPGAGPISASITWKPWLCAFETSESSAAQSYPAGLAASKPAGLRLPLGATWLHWTWALITSTPRPWSSLSVLDCTEEPVASSCASSWKIASWPELADADAGNAATRARQIRASANGLRDMRSLGLGSGCTSQRRERCDLQTRPAAEVAVRRAATGAAATASVTGAPCRT